MEKLARVTESPMRKKTGRGRDERVEALDNAGAAALAHNDTARLVPGAKSM